MFSSRAGEGSYLFHIVEKTGTHAFARNGRDGLNLVMGTTTTLDGREGEDLFPVDIETGDSAAAPEKIVVPGFQVDFRYGPDDDPFSPVFSHSPVVVLSWQADESEGALFPLPDCRFRVDGEFRTIVPGMQGEDESSGYGLGKNPFGLNSLIARGKNFRRHDPPVKSDLIHRAKKGIV